jgi:hypothetical protein
MCQQNVGTKEGVALHDKNAKNVYQKKFQKKNSNGELIFEDIQILRAGAGAGAGAGAIKCQQTVDSAKPVSDFV